jgi:hypothetical protein
VSWSVSFDVPPHVHTVEACAIEDAGNVGSVVGKQTFVV